jgi:DNA-binding transcriptional LysR family regulator
MYNRGIEAFLAVVRTQNISKAAEQLHLSQTTVSKRLRVLEQEVATVLFERGKGLKAIRLTPSGENFVALAERWDLLFRETQVALSSGPHISLSILMLDSIVSSIFPALYTALSRHEPKIQLNVVTSHSVEAYEEVDRRHVNVAFSQLERNHPNVIVSPCYSEPMVVLKLASTPFSQPGLLQPDELDRSHELYVRWSTSFQLWHDKRWDQSMPCMAQFDTARLLVLGLQEAEQWAIMPLSMAIASQKMGNYAMFFLSDPPPDRIVYKLTHKQPKSSTIASLKIFDHYLEQVIKSEFEGLIVHQPKL